ncbi:tRNA-uridine aminocarboxypropyltransferase [Pseudomonas sp. MF6747]|uniref:tRNA-uridine aminocarboxypropyltransferase n=1 Tax=Pseudomonas sp. MF6747 TaxID=2797527 RepID=UPI00190B2582|nr:tRNA-uridine aminocarboxypropyltransferase [Pseudomonas sp. MF6747]MBK3506638.1 DTW domain-containing protein [Pseudomonas sp. MF6747]
MTYTNAVAELSAKHKEASTKPFLARGSRSLRCEGCRLPTDHCVCASKSRVSSSAGFCLLMSKKELFKPSNTGFLIADVVPDTFAFCWSRVEIDPELIALLDSPEWQPYVVFPGEFVDAERVTNTVKNEDGKRPLFILLDATWTEARKIFRKSPYLNKFPVLSIEPENLSKYVLRRSKVAEHLCTSEIASLCLNLSGDLDSSNALDSYFDIFSNAYMNAKRHFKA